MRIAETADGDSITADTYDSLTCCGQPARVAHATDALPVPGAVCDKCRCLVTSRAGYGPATVQRCIQHRS